MITACVTTMMSILNNKRTLIVWQLLLFALAFGLFQVGREDAGMILSNMVLASLLSTWNIAITYITDSIVCDCNWTRTQNHLVLKRTLNHLAK